MIWSRFTATLLTVCWSSTRPWGSITGIAEAIQSLNTLPERCALVESEPERTQGLRQMLVDNYLRSTLWARMVGNCVPYSI